MPQVDVITLAREVDKEMNWLQDGGESEEESGEELEDEEDFGDLLGEECSDITDDSEIEDDGQDDQDEESELKEESDSESDEDLSDDE